MLSSLHSLENAARRLVASATPLLQLQLLHHPLWQYFAYAFWLLGGYLLLVRVNRLLEKWLQKWLAHHNHHLGGKLLERLMLPARVGLFLTLLISGFHWFQFPASGSVWHTHAYTLAIGICTMVASLRLMEVFLWQWKQRHARESNHQLNLQLYLLVDKGSRLFITLTISLMTLHNVGLNITSILASLSIGGAALALASQATLESLFGAVSILINHTFKIGDSIRVDTIEGTVEEITLSSTKIRNSQGYLVTLPNKNMAVATIINISQRQGWKSVLHLDMDYSLSSDQMEQACHRIEQLLQAEPRIGSFLVGFKGFEESGLRIEVTHTLRAKDYQEYLGALHRLNLQIKGALDEQKLHFARAATTICIAENGTK